MRTRTLAVSLVLAGLPAFVAGASQATRRTAPESFKANMQVSQGSGGVAAVADVKISRYTAPADDQALAQALKGGGHAALVAALKKAPVVGAVTIGGRSIGVRWARERVDGDHRRIVVVTEAPIYYLGAGSPDAKPTAGFDIGVLAFTVDSVGLGSGEMAPAAHVKFSEADGVEVEDYGGKRVALPTVTRDVASR